MDSLLTAEREFHQKLDHLQFVFKPYLQVRPRLSPPFAVVLLLRHRRSPHFTAFHRLSPPFTAFHLLSPPFTAFHGVQPNTRLPHLSHIPAAPPPAAAPRPRLLRRAVALVPPAPAVAPPASTTPPATCLDAPSAAVQCDGSAANRWVVTAALQRELVPHLRECLELHAAKVGKMAVDIVPDLFLGKRALSTTLKCGYAPDPEKLGLIEERISGCLKTVADGIRGSPLRGTGIQGLCARHILPSMVESLSALLKSVRPVDIAAGLNSAMGEGETQTAFPCAPVAIRPTTDAFACGAAA